MSDVRVFPCLLSSDRDRLHYLKIRAVEGVLAPGKRCQVQVEGAWRQAQVVDPWDHGYGSVLCLELQRADA